MVQLACVNLPALPLQLLLRRHTEWVNRPVAVLTEERPQGLILWVNERARQAGVVPGLRYAAGLARATALCVGTVSPAEITAGVKALSAQLQHFTPEVEPSEKEPGLFWLKATGRSRRFSSLQHWAHAVRADLQEAGFCATVVVGFSPFATAAVAKVRQGIVVFSDHVQEQEAVRRVALDRLGIAPLLGKTLDLLGVRTVGDLLRLPATGVLERFGVEAYRLHSCAAGALWKPLQPSRIREPIEQHIDLDEPETDGLRLLFLIKRSLHLLLTTLAARREALAELQLHLIFDGREECCERLRPATPTLDAPQILELIRLRLEALHCSAGVVRVLLTAHSTPTYGEQFRLFRKQPRRDLAAANRALARLRAEFGEAAILHAQLREGHLPEAQFTWKPLVQVVHPHPQHVAGRPLVRRLYSRPLPLPPPPRQLRETGWLVGSVDAGPVVRLVGPDVISGGWWQTEVQREYYFAETQRGDLLWIYYDRRRRRWYLHGRVE